MGKMPARAKWAAVAVATLLLGAVAAWLGLSSADLDHWGLGRQTAAAPSPQTPAAPTVPVRSGATIRIATFNIQVFGLAKEAKPQVFERLAGVVRQFDVVAVQEVRCDDSEFFGRFVKQINSGGRKYGYVIGPRLGRTSSKEQYAYVYDQARIDLARRTIYTLSDRNDWLHREPFVARFRVRGPPPAQAFSFTLVNIHTDPDEVEHEINALDDALLAVGRDGSGEDDIILLGDLNAAPRKFGELGRLGGVEWIVSAEPTNVRRTATYDNIIFDRRRTTEFTGRGGVYDLERELRLTREEVLELSDHLPVWGEFTATEGGSATVAAADGGSVQ